MKQGATRLRRVPETAENVADLPARASLDSSLASRAIPIDLRPVVSAYRKRGRFMLRIEKLPQLARFSAGQNNGDGTWSLLLDELEDLVYFAPKTVGADHMLAIRLIAKDETEAFTIALIDFPIRDADHEGAASVRPPAPLHGGAAIEASQDALRNELLQLKAELAAREAELSQLRGSAERMGVLLQQKLDAAVAEAQGLWKREEAARLKIEKTALEEQFEHRLAERDMHAQAVADIAHEQQASALRLMRQEFAATKEALVARDSELAGSRTQLERLRKDWEAEIVSVKAAAEAKAMLAFKAAETEWQARTDGALAAMTARRDTAEAAVASAAQMHADRGAELADLRARLERQRQQSEAEIASLKRAAEAQAAEALKAAEAGWQARTDKDLAAIRARCDAAESALAGAAAPIAARDAEVGRLHAQLERQRQQSDAEIAAAKVAAEAKTAHALKIAEAEWRERADKDLAAIGARCDAAEAALARAASPIAERDAEMGQLRAQLEQQRRQSEAEIASVKANAEATMAQALKAAQAEWRAQTDGALAALTARCEAADAALAFDAMPVSVRDAEVNRLQAELDYLRKWSEAEFAALQVAADVKEARSIKAAQAEWQARTDEALAALTARCQAAEAGLASTGAADTIREREDEVNHLRAVIDRQQQAMEAEISAAKITAERHANESIKLAEARWEKQSAEALAGAMARCEAAEAALASAHRASASRADDDAYVHSLEREIKSLRATLVDREAALVQAEALHEQQRLGTVRQPSATRWQPLSNRVEDDPREQAAPEKSNSKLLRDAAIVVIAAVATVLLFPRLEAMLPDTLRWQIETVGGVFAPNEPDAPAPVAVVPAPPKAAPPTMFVARSGKIHAEPSAGAPVVASLKRGASVAILEKRGNWDRVEISGAQDQGQKNSASKSPALQAPALQGWVFYSYLMETDPGTAAPPALAPARSASAPGPSGTVPVAAAAPTAPETAPAAPETGGISP